MQQKKRVAAAESKSADNRFVNADSDPLPSQSAPELSTGSIHRRRKSQSTLEPESYTHTSISCVSSNNVSNESCMSHRYMKCSGSVHSASCELSPYPFINGSKFHEGCQEFISPPTQHCQISTRKISGYDIEQHTREEHHRREQTRELPELNHMENLKLESPPSLITTDNFDHNAPPTVMPNSTASSPISLPTREELQSPSTRNIISTPRLSRNTTSSRLLEGAASSYETQRPSLALNTQIHRRTTPVPAVYQSPSSSIRTCSNGISPTTPASQKSSLLWSPAPFQASQEDYASSNEHDPIIPGHLDDQYPCELTSMRELPMGKLFPSTTTNQLLPGPLMYPHNSKDHSSWISPMESGLPLNPSVNVMFADRSIEPDISPYFPGPRSSCSEPKALVEKVWNTLSDHFFNSIPKLDRLQGNPLAAIMKLQTLQNLSFSGLARLRKFIEHNRDATPNPVEYLCFIYLIYSISSVISDNRRNNLPREFYDQAMVYSADFDMASRRNYCQIVTAIWHHIPQESTSRWQGQHTAKRPAVDDGQRLEGQTGQVDMSADPLVATGQKLLDELENIVVKSEVKPSIQRFGPASNLPQTQPNAPADASAESSAAPSADAFLVMSSAWIYLGLYSKYHKYGDFIKKLKAVQENAGGGYYQTSRRFELDLLHIGKEHFTVSSEFDQYYNEIRTLFNQLYSDTGIKERAGYHILSISFIEDLIYSVASEAQQRLYCDDYMQESDKNVSWSLPTSSVTQQVEDDQGVPDFDFNLDLPSFDSVGSSANQTFDGSNQPPTVAGDSEGRPSESFGLSPAQLSGAPLGIAPPGIAPPGIAPLHAYNTGSVTFRNQRPKRVRPGTPENSPSGLYGLSPGLLSGMPPGIAPQHAYNAAGPLQDQDLTNRGSSSRSSLGSTGQKVEASESCTICGYRPKGDPQWFKGSMAKHMKMQHSEQPPIIYKCPYPGCTSQYKNRKDNLRQHQMEKGHFVGDEAQRPPKRKRK